MKRRKDKWLKAGKFEKMQSAVEEERKVLSALGSDEREKTLRLLNVVPRRAKKKERRVKEHEMLCKNL